MLGFVSDGKWLGGLPEVRGRVYLAAGFRVLATGVCSIAVVAHKSLLLVVGS